MRKIRLLSMLGAMLGMSSMAAQGNTHNKELMTDNRTENTYRSFSMSRGMYVPTKSQQVKSKRLKAANKRSGRVK